MGVVARTGVGAVPRGGSDATTRHVLAHRSGAVTPASARIIRVVGSIMPVDRAYRVARRGHWH